MLLLGGGLVIRQLLIIPNIAVNKVQTVAVERKSAAITISANGTVKPERSTNISPQTSGLLKQLLVNEGDLVQQGQVIAYMDDAVLQAQRMQAEGKLNSAQFKLKKLLAGNRAQEVGQAQAQLDEARASLNQAELKLKQDQELFGERAISRRELENSQANRDTALAKVHQSQQSLDLQQAGSRPEDIAAAQAEVTAAEGELNQMQTQLSQTVVRAPFSGRVIRKYAEPGAFVAPTIPASSENSATSASILALATKNQIVAYVPETSIGRLHVGQTAQIKADAFPGKLFTGRVVSIASQSTLEQNVTSFEVKVSLSDPGGLLRSGMNVDVNFQVGALKNTVLVPTVAIVRQTSGTGIYVQAEDGQISFRPIQTGVTVGNQTEVQSGLRENERVLLSFPGDTKPATKFPPPPL
jgi:HlyD family secretion protein